MKIEKTICDKCKKKIKSEKDGWNSYKSYDYVDNKPIIKINKQKVIVTICIKLECGQEIDLCNSCANKILKLKVNK